jgi:translation elongation factor EF-4
LSKTDKLDSFIKNYGKDGVRFLLLFNIIKKRLETELHKEKFAAEPKVINEVCAKATQEILVNSKRAPSREEIAAVIQNLKKKLSLS